MVFAKKLEEWWLSVWRLDYHWYCWVLERSFWIRRWIEEQRGLKMWRLSGMFELMLAKKLNLMLAKEWDLMLAKAWDLMVEMMLVKDLDLALVKLLEMVFAMKLEEWWLSVGRLDYHWYWRT